MTIDTDRRAIAILRGVTPDEIVAVTETLIQAGFTTLEIPLNSPEPLTSIKLAAEVTAHNLGTKGMVGAGTVLQTKEVDDVCRHGGQFIVSPNCDAVVIARTRHLEMASYPGVFTPTEAFAALAAGANALKLFPANKLGPDGVAALRAVLPSDCALYAVGGIASPDFAAYAKSGISGFGIGSALYKPGQSIAELAEKADAIIAAITALYYRTNA